MPKEPIDMNNNENDYALNGTGCQNIGELRMAFDILRDTLFVNHNDAWDTKRIAAAVTQRMYQIQNQMEFDWDHLPHRSYFPSQQERAAAVETARAVGLNK